VLARTLLRDQAFADDNVAAAYGYWRQSAPFDVGGTIGKATEAILQAQARGQDPAQAARREANSASEANGALMRQSPLAIWGHALPAETLDAYVRADTRLTHPNRVCQDASAAFIVALAAVIREGLDGEAAYARASKWNGCHGQSPTVTQALAGARDKQPSYRPNEGHVLIALQNAFYQALHAESFEAGVVATVMGGGDTDTNAVIAGALLGAIYGARAVPAQWRTMVLTCRPRHQADGVHQPRPLALWPVDALVLTERLLVVGTQRADVQ
jgi:ADP-ribosylglycohydrolase